MFTVAVFFSLGFITAAVAAVLIAEQELKTGERPKIRPILLAYGVGLLTGYLAALQWLKGGFEPIIFSLLGLGVGFAVPNWISVAWLWRKVARYRLYHPGPADKELAERLVKVRDVLDYLETHPDNAGVEFTRQVIKTYYGATASGKAKRTDFYKDRARLEKPGDTPAKALAVQQYSSEKKTTPQETCSKFNLSPAYYKQWLEYNHPTE